MKITVFLDADIHAKAIGLVPQKQFVVLRGVAADLWLHLPGGLEGSVEAARTLAASLLAAADAVEQARAPQPEPAPELVGVEG
jgi:hypothetical protein